jgi:hypothetical protein
MNNQENIDKYFADKLNNYQRQASPEAWERIQQQVAKNERNIIPLWWKYAACASVALLVGTTYWITSNEQPTEIVAATNTTIPTKVLPIHHSTILPIEPSKVEAQQVVVAVPSKTMRVNSLALKNKITKTRVEPLTIEKNELVQVAKQPAEKPLISVENQPNTIVLIVNKTIEKQETIVLNLIDTKQEALAQTENIEENISKKQSRFNKIWQQLKRAKNGENVNWNDVGFKPQKVLARADAKLENVLTNGENTEK